MSWIAETLAEVADTLTAAGVPTAVDPRDVNIPGGWVTVGPIGFDYLSSGVRTIAVDVFLIARDTGTPDSLGALGDMLDRVILAGIPVGDVTPQPVALANHAGDPLPALTFRLTGDYAADPAPPAPRRHSRK